MVPRGSREALRGMYVSAVPAMCACMYVYVCVHVCVCNPACMYVYVYVYVRVMCVCMYVCGICMIPAWWYKVNGLCMTDKQAFFVWTSKTFFRGGGRRLGLSGGVLVPCQMHGRGRVRIQTVAAPAMPRRNTSGFTEQAGIACLHQQARSEA